MPTNRRLLALLAAASAAGCATDLDDLVPPTVDEDPALPALDLGDTRLHLVTAGDPTDPVVIALHGGPGGDHRSLRPLTALAERGYFVVLWDQRGTGLSRRHPCDEVEVDDYRRDLERIVARFAPPGRPVFLVGHSWGAMYATWFIDEHPGRITGAVLVEPGGFTRAAVDAYFSRLITEAPLAEELDDALWTAQLVTPDDHARADLLTASMYEAVSGPLGQSTDDPMPYWRGGGVVSRCLAPSAGDFDWTRHLAEQPGDVLFVRGDRNRVIRAEHVEALAAAYPHAQVVTLPGAGHDVHWARRDAFVPVVADYLDARLTDGGAP